ncbi:beta-ketoacyl synthase N-terminal-like domain-containing protein [Micromonospora sp. WMMD980]|uniref:beta-ketoacyl synthase N-terminal-like domain-containing protein n=1 Tax=Micromonospora sp. WMMD980 TaxID=3016088 RepID=UPI002416212C|nr:beta-ketoacyl synthase N-terminal-like domain-containing protein [Micromonospora sp. WMMD980]MDG4800851.1 beta-ketoacyl synthase N-terminal-like domain-containing protein [Micromonospora sp. WMMD980]
MSAVVTGSGVVSAAGGSVTDVLAAIRAGAAIRTDVRDRFPEPLPEAEAPAVAGFDVRGLLGRKGTSFLDRATALAMVACGRALTDGELTLDDDNRHRVGVVLGTTTGSLKSTMDFSRETLVQDKPYLVNPVLFPNTVMNCAAGQAAIRYGLRGVNATVAGGPLAFLYALRYALNAIRRGYADALLVGGVEEYTPNTAWAARLTDAGPAGEASAVYLLRRRRAEAAGARAEVLSVATGFAPDDTAAGLAGCARRALAAADVRASDVWALAGDDPDGLAGGVPAAVERLSVRPTLGDCQAAAGALAFGALLARYAEEPGPSGRPALLTGRSRDGGVAAAVVRGWAGAGDDHR